MSLRRAICGNVRNAEKIFWEAKKMYYVIVRLFGLWYIATFENGVMQYSIYGGYKREQDAKRQATIQKIKIEEIRR